ncbi:sigma-70 family RNA polymerase sigma factor [Aquihabitans sp. McL0605]|uniref:RNA polymerase sigma factor n=1 Tax=Aquihabitans sp. McL0605 TaxID=3415671 RepID=UPI003CF638FB
MTSTEPRAAHLPTGAHDDPRDEALLLDAARDGSAGAFGILYERHRAHAVATARRALSQGDSSAAEDVAEVAFLRVFAAVRNGKGPTDTLRYYLTTAVRREAWRTQRRRRRQSEVVELWAVDEPTAAEQEPVAPEPLDDHDPSAHVLLSEAFRGLSERWRNVLWLTEVEGRKPAEIAPMLGVSAGTASALAYRARQGLLTAYLDAYRHHGVDDACAALNGRLGAYVAAGCIPEGFDDVVAHLEGCPSCRDVTRGVDVMGGAFRAVAPFGLLTAGLWAKGLAATGAAAGAAGAGALGGVAVAGHASAGGGAGGGGAGAGAAAGGAAAGGIGTTVVAVVVVVVVVAAAAAGLAGAGRSPGPGGPDEAAAVATTRVVPSSSVVTKPTSATSVDAASTSSPSASRSEPTITTAVPSTAPATTAVPTTAPRSVVPASPSPGVPATTTQVPRPTTTTTTDPATTTTTVVAPLVPARLTGRATRPHPEIGQADLPVPGVLVEAFDHDGVLVQAAFTGSDGRWELKDVAPGTYRVVAVVSAAYAPEDGPDPWQGAAFWSTDLGAIELAGHDIDLVDLRLRLR